MHLYVRGLDLYVSVNTSVPEFRFCLVEESDAMDWICVDSELEPGNFAMGFSCRGKEYFIGFTERNELVFVPFESPILAWFCIHRGMFMVDGFHWEYEFTVPDDQWIVWMPDDYSKEMIPFQCANENMNSFCFDHTLERLETPIGLK